MYFHGGDPTFFDFPETQVGSFAPPEPPETNPPPTSILSTRLNFNFGGNLIAYQPWITVDAISIPRTQHPLRKHP